jgi:hypothetical protein
MFLKFDFEVLSIAHLPARSQFGWRYPDPVLPDSGVALLYVSQFIGFTPD